MKKIVTLLLSIAMIFCFTACTATTQSGINASADSSTSVVTTVKDTKKAKKISTSAPKSQANTSKSTTKAKSSDNNLGKNNAATKSTTVKNNTNKNKKTTATAKTTKTVSQSCTLTVECKKVLSNMENLKSGHQKFVPSSGYIINKTLYTFSDGDTVYEVLKNVCNKNNVKLTAKNSGFGVYISGINNIDEKDCGTSSGWLYSVNAKSPPYSCDNYTVCNGDNIIFSYTC